MAIRSSMANVDASWGIVDLTAVSDEDADHELENISVDALRAQDAASRCLEQAMNLGSAQVPHDPRPISLWKQNLTESNKQTSTTAGDTTRASSRSKIQSAESEAANQSRRQTPGDASSPIASADLLQSNPVTLDSGLGESVSGTEDARSESRSLANTTSPPLKPIIAPITECKPALQRVRSEQRSSAKHQAMDDLIFSCKAQYVPSPPRKRMGGRPPKGISEKDPDRKRTRDGLDVISVFGASKKRRTVEGNILGTNRIVKDVKNQSPLRRSLGDISFLYCKHDETVAEVFEEVIYPILKTAVEDRKGLLSEDKLIEIAKTVSFMSL